MSTTTEPISEADALPQAIAAGDVKRGMRIAAAFGRPYGTVVATTRNRSTKRMTLKIKYDDGTATTLYPPVESTLYRYDPETAVARPEQNVLTEETQSRLDHVKGHIAWKVQDVARDLQLMAEFYEAKAAKLQQMSKEVAAHGTTWGPVGFETVAREYVKVLAHNSDGRTDSTAAAIAELAGYAMVLTVLHPERHQVEEG